MSQIPYCGNCVAYEVCIDTLKRGDGACKSVQAEIDAALASRPAMMPEWISVKDKLPCDGQVVLADSPLGYSLTLWQNGQWHYKDSADDDWGDAETWDHFTPTHWMPLPKAPDHFAAANKGERDDL